jgi:hypothetical protein
MLWHWKPLKWLGKRRCWGNVGQTEGDVSLNLREDELGNNQVRRVENLCSICNLKSSVKQSCRYPRKRMWWPYRTMLFPPPPPVLENAGHHCHFLLITSLPRANCYWIVWEKIIIIIIIKFYTNGSIFKLKEVLCLYYWLAFEEMKTYFFLKTGREDAKWIYLLISVLKRLIVYFLLKKSPYQYGTRRMMTILQGQLLD